MLKEYNKEYRKSVKDYKDRYLMTHTYNTKKKYMKIHINKIVSLYNELYFYINELEQFFVNDYLNFNRCGINLNNGEYNCLINGLDNEFDWNDGYHIGNVYNCFVRREEISNNTLWETYSDCYYNEFGNWIVKFSGLSREDQEKLVELFENNNILHYYGDNGCLMHEIISIKEALNGSLDKYFKFDEIVKVKTK